MVGLVLNDLYSMKRTIKMYPVFMVLFFVLGITTESLDFFSSFITIYSTMFGISIFSYHEAYGWDTYANTLPVKRSQIVGAFYLVALLFIATGALLGFCMNVILCMMGEAAFLECMFAFGLVVSVGVIIISVVIPLLVKFGSERGRLIMIGSYAILFLGLSAVGRFFEERLASMFVNTESVAFLVVLALTAAIAAFILSYRITLTIYRKKEF